MSMWTAISHGAAAAFGVVVWHFIKAGYAKLKDLLKKEASKL